MDAQQKLNRLTAGMMFTFFISGACSLALGSLVPFFRETYGISYERAGMLISLQSTGNMAAVALMGVLPALLGRRASVLLTALWMSVTYLIFTTGWGGGVILPAACLVMGLAKGGVSNFVNTVVSTLPGRRAGIGYNLAHGSYAVGALASPLLIVACTTGAKGNWRTACGILLAMALVMLVYLVLAPLPESPIRKAKKGMQMGFLRQKTFWFSAGILFCYISAEYSITGWLVTYFQDIGALSDRVAHLMSTLLWLVMFAGRMVGACLVGRVPRRILLVVDGTGVLASFLLVFFSHSQLPIVLGIIGVGLFMATIYTTAATMGSESMPGNDLGISIMTLCGTIGGVITPAAVGFVAQRAGIHAGMGVVVAATVLLFIIMLLAALSTGKKQNQ